MCHTVNNIARINEGQNKQIIEGRIWECYKIQVLKIVTQEF